MTAVAPTKRTRLLLCTSGGLFGALVLRRLVADPRVDVVGIVLSSRVYSKHSRWLDGVRAHYQRSGLRYLLYLWAATGLADLLGRISGLASVRAQAAALGCPVHETRDINDMQGLAFVTTCAPELLVSAFFNQRIGAPVFDLPSAGAVNIHPSLLPALKGVDPVFYAKLRGIAPIGVTLHRLAAELDTGPILAQSQVAQREADSVLRATAALFACGAELLLEQLDAICAGAAGQTQAAVVDYDSWPTPLQVRALRLSGQRLVRLADIRDMLLGRFSASTAN